MNIQSTAFKNNGAIPVKYTCDGEDMSPPLSFVDVPDTAQSLALTMTDPDATSGEWVHWVVWNINPKTSEVAEGSIPDNGIQGQTSAMEAGGPVYGYGGPCPPSGTHRYVFRLYALDSMMDIDIETGVNELKEAMRGHVIAESELIGTCTR
jgi:hypothetical protein